MYPSKKVTVYGVAGYRDHLIIVCSDPFFCPRSGCEVVVSVNLSSWKEGAPINDPACILNAGDHSFIKHKSFIVYEKAVSLRVPLFIQRVQDGTFIELEPLTDEIYQRVLQGFILSDRTPKRIINQLKSLDLI